MLRRIVLWVCALLGGLAVAAVVAVYAVTYHPRAREAVPIRALGEAPLLKAGQKIRILSWNVQYLAGKNHVFWYEARKGFPGVVSDRPSPQDIARTLREVARVITEENPDIVLLQELDDGSRRTDFGNQSALLLELLPRDYAQLAEAFYHKASYIPDRHIRGAVGMKLGILSKYKIRAATRHQLPLLPKDPLTRQFYFKRAMLEARLPVQGGGEFVVVDTHLDAWTQGTDTLQRQVQAVKSLLTRLDQEGCAWCLGGDFNGLAPGPAYSRLAASEQVEYDEKAPLTPLFEHGQSVPSPVELSGTDCARWLTHWQNRLAEPDRAIDFLFFSRNVTVGAHQVRQRDPGHTELLRISDHFPVIAEVEL